ncbi:polysaccharide biosynthesis tyrosine autokinase [Rhizobium sp. BK251]|uniref:polysaccharide biosynthesis tyrosine autokinase n=1 Tax=Rhizobium sp. BK251 TaxID=2512125 RepID=UPI00105287F5|nr:polysaccharide biosynthesis tyrosine autokinase [Rhizobium sp. BK251]TCL72971.1 succinoglycan biosynthesis transport protein ExoP [Rhizobium sp. BK251]
MLSPGKIVTESDEVWGEGSRREVLDFDRLISVARRQWRIVLVSALVFALLGVVYILTAVPKFTSETSVLIDRGTSGLVNELSDAGVSVDDEGTVLSQVEILKSDTVALAVVDKLNLVNDPVFMAPSVSIFSLVKSVLDFRTWFADAVEDEAEAKRQRAAGILQTNMAVSRIGRSYVLSISYTSTSPSLAAHIAAGLADAYLVDKLNSKYDATRRASDWLQERIDELKQKALDSDLAVQKFRAANGLISAKEGLLVSDQQLSELSSALIVAQADTARARAKYDRIKAIIDSGRTDAIVTDVLDSSISNDLRQKYLEASKREAEISSRLGTEHVQAVRLRGEMQEYQRLMFEELNRIAESYQSELDVAQTREKSLSDSVSQATNVSANAGEMQVQLRELERAAETYRNLYQTFLTRFQEATQQQSFPISEARIITAATEPLRPSSPQKPLVLAFSIFLGLICGSGIGAYREFRDRFFRTGEQVRDSLNLEYLGLAPLVDTAALSLPATTIEHPRSLRRVNAISSYVVDHPLSAFAETMRSAKIAIDLDTGDRKSKVIGIVSSLPSEGKSTIATNFAELLAMQGARTLLIDADLRNPGTTRAIGRHAEVGLLEALLEHRPMKELLLIDERTKLAFIPAVVKRRVPHSSELLASAAMNALLDEARAIFDYVVLDLPPLAPVVDARAICSSLDKVVFVIEWGRTSRKIVRSTLFSEPDLAEKCAGVILNKVDIEKMKLYRAYGSSEYYYSRYSSYYHDG